MVVSNFIVVMSLSLWYTPSLFFFSISCLLLPLLLPLCSNDVLRLHGFPHGMPQSFKVTNYIRCLFSFTIVIYCSYSLSFSLYSILCPPPMVSLLAIGICLSTSLFLYKFREAFMGFYPQRSPQASRTFFLSLCRRLLVC